MNHIRVIKEDLRAVDCGGGFREITTTVTIDTSQPLRLQRHALFYEILASYLEPAFSYEFVLELCDSLQDGLDELELQPDQAYGIVT